MRRQPNTTLPVTKEVLTPSFDTEHTIEDLQRKQDNMTTAQKPANPLSSLEHGHDVAVQQGTRRWSIGKIVGHAEAPRSYKVQMDNLSLLRRNFIHLRPIEKEKTSSNTGNDGNDTKYESQPSAIENLAVR